MEVENPVVRTEFAVAYVERLVVDEQSQEFPVGDVDERLARLGEAVTGFGIRLWTKLVEAVQVRSGQTVRLALVEVPAQSNVAVGEREPTTKPKPPAPPASTPDRASSKTADCAAETPSLRAAARYVSGAGLPPSFMSRATTPSTMAPNKSVMPPTQAPGGSCGSTRRPP